MKCTGALRVLLGKPRGKRPLGRYMLRWEEIGWWVWVGFM